MRYVQRGKDRIKQGSTPFLNNRCESGSEEFSNYAENVFKPYKQLWSEAMLSATIQFIHHELGIDNIYYHTHETEQKLKRVYGAPPRSLYTSLPIKFCFQLTHKEPNFMTEDRSFIRKKRSIKQAAWYKLAM